MARKVRRGLPHPWFVYILRCAGGSLYTGVTTDLSRRLRQHNAGRGGAYTRAFGPVRLVWKERKAGRSEALKREAAIKRLSRSRKETLLRSFRRLKIKGRS